MNGLGAAVAGIREGCGMSQYVAADASRVSRSYLSRIENDQMTPSLGTLEKLADGMHVDIRAFLDTTDAMLADGFIHNLLWIIAHADNEHRQKIVRGLAALAEVRDFSEALFARG